jgi:hypothetical protein
LVGQIVPAEANDLAAEQRGAHRTGRRPGRGKSKRICRSTMPTCGFHSPATMKVLAEIFKAPLKIPRLEAPTALVPRI